MASITPRSGKFQLRIKHKLLPNGQFFATFDTHAAASGYGDKVVSLLDRGLIPPELLVANKPAQAKHDIPVTQILLGYLEHQKSASRADHGLVEALLSDPTDFGGTRFRGVTYTFAVAFVATLRVKRRNAPGTVRGKVGCLGRVWDWYLSANALRELANPWRILPSGYSVATTEEQNAMRAAGDPVKRDQKRSRRLEEGEQQRIEVVLAGGLLIEAQRPMRPGAELGMMFQLIVETGMRLRECYTLTRGRVLLDMGENVLDLAGTKGHRGAVKPRQVPLRPRLRRLITEWLGKLPPDEDRLFPDSWSGSLADEDLKSATAALSAQFTNLFRHAQCVDLHEHDLRHEATCRWVLLKNENGEWLYREIEIVKIMGWESGAQFQRYASLRGADLSSMLDHLDSDSSYE